MTHPKTAPRRQIEIPQEKPSLQINNKNTSVKYSKEKAKGFPKKTT